MLRSASRVFDGRRIVTATVQVDTLPLDDWWESEAMTWLRRRAASGVPFQAADMTTEVGTPVVRNHVGSVMAKGKTLGLIAPTGRRVPSTSPGANGRKVDEWIGCTS